MSRSLPGRARVVAWEPNSTVRDCGQMALATLVTASTASLTACCSTWLQHHTFSDRGLYSS